MVISLKLKFLIGGQDYSEEEALQIYKFLSKYFDKSNAVVSYQINGGLVCPDPQNPKHTIISKPIGED